MAWLLQGTPRTSERLSSVDTTDFINQNIIKSYEIIPVQIDYRIDPSILNGVVLLQSLHSSFYIFKLLYIYMYSSKNIYDRTTEQHNIDIVHLGTFCLLFFEHPFYPVQLVFAYFLSKPYQNQTLGYCFWRYLVQLERF